MTVIRYGALPHNATPPATNKIATDGTTTSYSTLTEFVNAGRPYATQAEAEAGVSTTTGMNPLRTAQEIAAIGATQFATLAQGLLADTSIQPAVLDAALATIGYPGTFVINTYTEAQTLTIPVFVKSVTLMGRLTYGDRAGIIPCVRVNAPITAHNGWFRSVDRFLADGTTNATNGGYWEFQLGNFCNVCAFGALGNGTTDDYAAINGALNYIKTSNYGQGTVYFPPAGGSYVCLSTLTLNTRSITFCSDNELTTLTSGGTDLTLLEVEGGLHYIHHLKFYGKGITGLTIADTTIGTPPTLPVVWFKSTAVNSKIEHCIIYGGYDGLRMNGGDNKIYDMEVSRCYGNAMVTVTGGHHFRRNAMDQDWPVSQPSNYQAVANPMPAWTVATAYSVNDVVSLGGWIIQCRVAGTSHASTSPTPMNYLVDWVDNGTLRWRLVCPTDYYGYNLIATAQEVFIENQDLSGCLTVGIAVDSANTGLRLKVDNCIIGQTLRQAILIQGGKDITIHDIHTGSGFQAGFACVQISANVTGDVRISRNYLEAGNRSVYIAPTTPNTVCISIDDNFLKPVLGGGVFAHCIDVVANVTDFSITKNRLVAGSQGIFVDAGTSDHYVISGNINKARLATGFFVSDSGTGLNKYIAGNV